VGEEEKREKKRKEELSRRKWKNSARAESRENGKWPELLDLERLPVRWVTH
jgi:hypothetical protein